jgi:hypothetical protein
MRLPPSESRGLDSRQLAAANSLSNPLSLILLASVDALRQASHRDYDGHQRRHHEPFHEPLFHYVDYLLGPPRRAGVLKS